MAERSDQIEQHIYEKRQELGEDLDELQYKFKRAVDWRAQVEDRPFTMLGLAFAGGLVAAALFGNARVSRRIRRRSAQQWQRTKGHVEHSARRAISEVGEKVAFTWDHLKDAVADVAAAKLAEYLDELLPGVHERYSRERRGEGKQYDRGERVESRDTGWQRNVSSREAGYARQSL
jgi:hypothetical protein